MNTTGYMSSKWQLGKSALQPLLMNAIRLQNEPITVITSIKSSFTPEDSLI